MTKPSKKTRMPTEADSSDLSIDCLTDPGSDYSGVQGASEAPAPHLLISQVDPTDPDVAVLDRAWQELQAQANERPTRNGAARKRISHTSPRR